MPPNAAGEHIPPVTVWEVPSSQNFWPLTLFGRLAVIPLRWSSLLYLCCCNCLSEPLSGSPGTVGISFSPFPLWLTVSEAYSKWKLYEGLHPALTDQSTLELFQKYTLGTAPSTDIQNCSSMHFSLPYSVFFGKLGQYNFFRMHSVYNLEHVFNRFPTAMKRWCTFAISLRMGE